jgi:hypothetical protein
MTIFRLQAGFSHFTTSCFFIERPHSQMFWGRAAEHRHTGRFSDYPHFPASSFICPCSMDRLMEHNQRYREGATVHLLGEPKIGRMRLEDCDLGD